MNIDFKLKLPLISIEDPTKKNSINIYSHLMLKPLYALESDVISSFSNLEDKDLPWVRKLLFNSSLTVYRLTKPLEGLSIISKEDLFLLRRDFVICIVTNEIAKQSNKDLAASISRAKTLGDFSVSTSKKGDSAVLLQIIKDSSDCIDEMKDLINDLEQSTILPRSFVKGRYNPRTRVTGRLWWHSELSERVVDGFASKKYYKNNTGYKAGTFNLDYYSKYSNYSLVEYYREVGVDNVSES